MPSWMGFPVTQSRDTLSTSLLQSVSCTNTQMKDLYLLLYRYVVYMLTQRHRDSGVISTADPPQKGPELDFVLDFLL